MQDGDGGGRGQPAAGGHQGEAPPSRSPLSGESLQSVGRLAARELAARLLGSWQRVRYAAACTCSTLIGCLGVCVRRTSVLAAGSVSRAAIIKVERPERPLQGTSTC